jgi:ribonuclease G
LRRELLIAAGPGEWRAALLVDGVPAELFVERGDRSETASIHLGRVSRLVPGLGAALVDIGEERPAFLPRGEVVPRGQRLHEGERVLVQIRREAQGGKAARVTMAIALRGRLAELRLGRPGLVGGGPLAPEEQAQRFAAVDTLTHPASGAGSPLSRIAGEGAERSEAGEGGTGLRLLEPAPVDALDAEVRSLAERWRNIIDRTARLDPPARLDPVASFAAALANAVSVPPGQILVDDAAPVPDVRAAFSDTVVQHVPEAEWLIDLDGAFAEALSERIALPGGGGSVHFEPTRAGVLIDVDTGTPEAGSPERNGLRTNLAAAGSIARQIRLRNLGGPIVIDFVGLDSRGSRERVRAALADALASDPAQPQILGWTRLGHLELVRPRRGRPLTEALLERRPGGALVKTAVAVAHEALRALRREARAQPGRNWRLVVAPDVAAALAGRAEPAVKEAEQRFARKIAIEADSGYDREQFQIIPL